MTRASYSSRWDRNFSPALQQKNRLQSFVPVAALFAVILALGAPSNALAEPLQIVGQYTGQINGVSISATASGQMDTSGSSLNHIEIAFQSLPSGFNPFALGGSWASSYHGAAALPTDCAVNLFPLSGGNYVASRTVSWSSLPGEQIVLVANVSTANGVMTATQIVNGTYSGPTDLIGVTNYQMLWTQINPTTIEVISTATLLRANGQSFTAEITSVYSGLSAQMPVNQQVGTYTFSNQSFSNNTLSWDWQGEVDCVPEPGTMLLLGTGLAGVAIKTRKKLKSRRASKESNS